MSDDLNYLLGRSSWYGEDLPSSSFEDTLKFLEECHVLVIGAGGLGCELLKDLVMIGFKNVEIIDMDTIDVSNLNRQFLFRKEDIGRPKAQVAAEFVNRRIKGVNIRAHYADITTMPLEFYREFDIVVAGLDSVNARRWINSTLHDIKYDQDEIGYENAIPLVDGGTEGLKGQSRLVIPSITSCLECSLDLFPPDPLNFQMCTLTERPRQPEHCIEYIIRKWDSYKQWKNVKLNKDDPEHLAWIHQKALERSNEFGIPGVTFKLTQGVVKRIIPAVASTNSIIAASCANEAFKLVTLCSKYLDNYMAYNGQDGIYTNTFIYKKNPNCLICMAKRITLKVSPLLKLAELIDLLKEDNSLRLVNPSISIMSNKKPQRALYFPGLLAEQTKLNLGLTLQKLGVESNDTLFITDPSLTISSHIKVIIIFQ